MKRTLVTLFASTVLLVTASALGAPAQAQTGPPPPAMTNCTAGYQVFPPRISSGKWLAGASATNCTTKVYNKVCAAQYQCYPGLFLTQGQFQRASGSWFYVNSNAVAKGSC